MKKKNVGNTSTRPIAYSALSRWTNDGSADAAGIINHTFITSIAHYSVALTPPTCIAITYCHPRQFCVTLLLTSKYDGLDPRIEILDGALIHSIVNSYIFNQCQWPRSTNFYRLYKFVGNYHTKLSSFNGCHVVIDR